MMNIVGHTKVIYIRVKVEESWGPIHPLVDLAFGFVKIGPKLDNWFLKLGIMKTTEIWQKKMMPYKWHLIFSHLGPRP